MTLIVQYSMKYMYVMGSDHINNSYILSMKEKYQELDMK